MDKLLSVKDVLEIIPVREYENAVNIITGLAVVQRK
jgi:hypothetical protein